MLIEMLLPGVSAAHMYIHYIMWIENMYATNWWLDQWNAVALTHVNGSIVMSAVFLYLTCCPIATSVIINVPCCTRALPRLTLRWISVQSDLFQIRNLYVQYLCIAGERSSELWYDPFLFSIQTALKMYSDVQQMLEVPTAEMEVLGLLWTILKCTAVQYVLLLMVSGA